VFDGKDLVVPCSYEGDDIDAIGTWNEYRCYAWHLVVPRNERGTLVTRFLLSKVRALSSDAWRQ